MAQGLTILVAASDTALRESLRFLLEVEGYTVVSHERIPHVTDLATDFDCVVVDETLVREGTQRLSDLTHRAQPIVLMVSHFPGVPALAPVRLVHKPAPGSVLVDAVRHAVRSPTPCTT